MNNEHGTTMTITNNNSMCIYYTIDVLYIYSKNLEQEDTHMCTIHMHTYLYMCIVIIIIILHIINQSLLTRIKLKRIYRREERASEQSNKNERIFTSPFFFLTQSFSLFLSSFYIFNLLQISSSSSRSSPLSLFSLFVYHYIH